MSATAALRPAGLCLALLLAAPALAKRPSPPPQPAYTITARMIVEKQLAAQSSEPGRLSGTEAKRIHDRYLAGMGTPVQATRDEQGRNSQ